MDFLLPFDQFFRQFSASLTVAWSFLSWSWYIIVPLVFYPLFFILWKKNISGDYASKISNVLLEIIPPRNIEKSPKPFELLFQALSGTYKGPSTYEEFCQGYFQPMFSFEIVGDDGVAHFYIRTPRSFRSLIEAHLYAQYPDTEVVEVPADYVTTVPRILPNKQWDLWGADFELIADNPYPIRTYPSFEEDITGTMIDPLSGLIEVIGKLPPGLKIWLQYIISPKSEKESAEEGQKAIDKFTGREKPAKPGFIDRLFTDIGDVFGNLLNALTGAEFTFSAAEEKKQEQPLEFRLTPGEKEKLKALERNATRTVFTTHMRMILLGRKENFDRSFLSSFIGGLKQFNDQGLNGFKPEDISKTYANYGFFAQKRLRYRQRKIFARYKDRDPSGMNKTSFTLSTEELATVYHLPDQSVVAPALRRTDARRAGAPSNLPV